LDRFKKRGTREGVPFFIRPARSQILGRAPTALAFAEDTIVPMRIRLLLPAAGALLSLSGCGYHTLGSAANLPPAVHTIAIPVFKNETQSYHTEVAMTQAVIREFNGRTRLSVVPGDDAGQADATLRGVIVSESVQPLTYKTQTTTSVAGSNSSFTSSFLITVNANVVVTDRDNRVLYQHTNYVFHEQYETTSDLASFIQEDSPAVQRMSRDFAQALVGDILESF
jgi:outer membrane lipopolysaccharide assembly protein LptE/RlpB